MDAIWLNASMKMTLNIDDGLLDRVMAFTGAKTKTEAIDVALREMDRRARLIEVLGRDHGMTSEDWRNAFEPGYDVTALRAAEQPSTYGRKPRSRR
jgi:Arc/MetJ family transcription regulator